MRAGVAVSAALLLAACGSKQPEARVEIAARDAMPAQETSADAPAVDNLGIRAARAMREGRMYAPAGDSAIDHWLAARERDPDDATTQAAIIDMQPYLLIACEQAIAVDDFDEAHRLFDLMMRSAPGAPALPRLATAIGDAEKAQLLAREAQEDEVQEQARKQETARAEAAEAPKQAVQATAAEVAAEPVATADRQEPPVAASGTPPAPDRAAARTIAVAPVAPVDAAPAAAVSPSPASAGASTASTAPRLLRKPPPRYPLIAMSRRIEGSVRVAFTVNTDGTVANVRVVSAEPDDVFNHAAVEAVEQYRFAPGGRRQDSAVTINFSLGGSS